MLTSFLIVLAITFACHQLLMNLARLRGLSLAGPHIAAGYLFSAVMMLLGGYGVISQPFGLWMIGWLLLTIPLTLAVSALAGSSISPPSHPDQLFKATHPAHQSSVRLNIPDGEYRIPAYQLTPTVPHHGRAVIIIPGAGDHKVNFKWRLVETLLEAGFIVLTIDKPGHGDSRHPLQYPDALTIIPSVITYLRQQSDITQIGLIGISLGGALTLSALRQPSITPTQRPDALVIIGTPLHLVVTNWIVLGEMWYAYRTPILRLFREVTPLQLRRSWLDAGMRSPHTLTELFELLNPQASIAALPSVRPLLLVYSHHDVIAPVTMGQMLQRAAPHAELLESKKASHVTLTLLPRLNQKVAAWLNSHLND